MAVTTDDWLKLQDEIDALLEIVDALCFTLLKDDRTQIRSLPNISDRARNLRNKRLQLKEEGEDQ